MRKRSFLLVAGACLATLSLAMGSAMADPTLPTPVGPRALAGTGSDTTQGVMNGLAGDLPSTGFAGILDSGGNKLVASYDAAGASPITTKGAAGSAPCTIARPSGSGAGVNALAADRTAGTHCLQFARSSTDDHATAPRPGQHLTYIPFATDSVAYATLGTSSISRNLSLLTLQKIYSCDSAFASFKPLLPQFNSGTRKFFLQNILGFTDSSDYTTLHPCVKDTDSTGAPLLENTGKLLNDKFQIEPYSVSVWLSQVNKIVNDDHGTVLIGNIGGISSLTLNSSATGTRPVFNVLPNKLVASGPNSRSTFVGSSSAVCSNAATIQKLGLATRSDCGSTTIQSDPDLGTDTVGPGE